MSEATEQTKDVNKWPWVMIGFKLSWGMAFGWILMWLMVFMAGAIREVYADSRADFMIQAPTENVDATPRPIETLDFYTMYCDGDTTTPRGSAPVAGPSQSIRAIMPTPGDYACTATVTTDTGTVSAQSNSVTKTFTEFAPLAPALSP